MAKPAIVPDWTDESDLAQRLQDIGFRPAYAVLDFDETLWLRNSTEEFIRFARPSIIVAVVLQILGLLKPWRLCSRQNPDYYRDWIRIWAVVLVSPWSVIAWRNHAAKIGRAHVNAGLLRDIAAIRPERIVVATYGFDFIVKPLVAAIDPGMEVVVASSLRDAPRLRAIGKGYALECAIGADDLTRSIVVTDNFVDQDLCSACAHGFYVRWPEAVYEQAGLTPMIPLAYTSKVKRPKENYLLNGLLGYDFAVLWLAFAVFSPTILPFTVALGFYLLAFFAVYEIGYFDNDRVGLIKEAKPVVSPEFARYSKHFCPGWAWVFGTVLAGLGAGVETLGRLGVDGSDGLLADLRMFAWNWLFAMLLIGLTRATFIWFNALQPSMRFVPMLVLQVERTLGYALLLPTGPVGALLCISHAIGRWIPYVIYRYGGDRRDFPAHVTALLVFLTCLPLLAISDRRPFGEMLTPELGVVLLYLGLRAAKDMARQRSRGFRLRAELS
ncbi:hypothetical protein [uncultured Sphingomonas sp.]|uniref:hypothetical protein n=1 Tax=uncultured Sphingomonas sp. TaxID=158754 RepID=UPI00261A18AF|nr:hypothetical protein [uncultured Sphingomonas sp.]